MVCMEEKENENELDGYRAEIDAIDRQMMALFEARMDTAKKIGTYRQRGAFRCLTAPGSKRLLRRGQRF